MKAKPLLNSEGDRIGSQWRCHCGRLVESYSGHDVDCDCGQMFNGFGQQLRPQSQWGEGGGLLMQMINEVTVIYSRQLAGVSASGRPRFNWVAQVGRVKLPAAPSLSAAKKAAAALDDWDYAFMAVKQGAL